MNRSRAVYIRVFVATTVLVLVVATTTLAQSPSVFTNPSIDLAAVRRFIVLPFSADRSEAVRDPFAQEKATIVLIAGLRRRNLHPLDLAAVINRIEKDTGVNFSGPSTEEKIRVFISELPKHVDAVLIGHVSAWGLFSRDATQLIRVPVYGYVSGYGGSASWQSSQWIPVRRTSEVSVVGLSLAIVRVAPDASPTLAWQYTHVHSDRARRRTPDVLAEAFLNDIVNAFPLKP